MNKLISDLQTSDIPFVKVIENIEKEYQHTPTAFKNGDVFNEADQNQGSAKVFAFAKLKKFDQDDTLLLFAEHYQAVLADPEGSNHHNIRQFMKHGWSGIRFEGEALTAK